MSTPAFTPVFFDRDLSWLKFNELVLEQAENPAVPVLEQIKFLSIFSSNLDEFYRVRMPVLHAVDKIVKKGKKEINIQSSAVQAVALIEDQQQKFGRILKDQIIPELEKNNITFWYDKPLDNGVFSETSNWFYSQVLAFLHPAHIIKDKFYPKNNRLYFLIFLKKQDQGEEQVVLNIPSDKLPRFFSINQNKKQHIVFLDDIIRFHLPAIFKNCTIKNCYSFKITRDAEIDLKDEYEGDIAEQIEKQLEKREFGYATRLLYSPGMPLRVLEMLIDRFNLHHANRMPGGVYHNLKDLFDFPVKNTGLSYHEWPAVIAHPVQTQSPVFDDISKGDIIVHTPYQSYNIILRFFNEAAIDAGVEEIYVSLYRVASDSRIVNALISAAKNGKKVNVLVELKARFDEANNLKWAKKLKNAGASIIYSVTALKVHAKIALVKRRQHGRLKYFGLLGTGNFNEGTARVYTDHILMTGNGDLLREVELLFIFLAKRVKPEKHPPIYFEHLLVSKFNLRQRFIGLIDREIELAKQGKPARITLKINNIEEQVLISKLYEASNAGVSINIIARSICCLMPGVKGMSENIRVTRIVDRYLEHGRVFIFNNDNKPEVYLGSADWMNRNIYHRIEVCYPIYDPQIKQQLLDIVDIQLKDDAQAVAIDDQLNNVPFQHNAKPQQSQLQIYNLLNKTSH
ncbi:polyphosphate kinase 1 [Mucilaginibacter sp. PPCGB 2223]|nr:polyphosphate kinase 1 [Mucilaginibacter sp. PPCGB 2223]